MAADLSPTQLQRFRDYFAERRDAVVALTRALVEQESPSGDAEGSRAVVTLLETEMRALGATATLERIEAPGNYGVHLRMSVFGESADSANGADGADDARTTLLLGHTDTVHPRGSLALRPWREEDGRLYAPGIFDMKANCALAVEALRACASLGQRPRRRVVLLLTCDEETGSASGRALVEEEARRAEQVLVLEPSAPGGHAKTARKGTGLFTLFAEGRAAHAGLEPEKGASAILELARQIERLHALSDAARGVNVNVGVVAGGTRSNVVAAEARADIDVRFSTNEDARQIKEAILNLRPCDERVRLRVEGDINRPPLERTQRVVSLYERARAVAAALDYELGETSVGGASDGNFAASVGAAVLDGLGVAGDGAHASHEHILTTDIARRGALLAALVAAL
ncbi:MAG TPA: M20/M25/M40 family metallo-hydrolase [Pyrinomonadaceae bacterium]